MFVTDKCGNFSVCAGFALVVVPVVEGCGNRVAHNIDCTDIDIVEMVEDIVAVVVVSDSLSLKDMMIQEHC